MGFLSDVKKPKLSEFFVNHRLKLIFVSFTVGTIWFLVLASENLNNKTYFSENALLPGLVVREFNPGSSLFRLLDNLEEETKYSPHVPYSWIQAQFRQLGLDVYNHNFTMRYPFGSDINYPGFNIYAILRAPKASSTEALVISTPYRGSNTIHEPTLPSIALMVELARYFRRHSYWSKDIIFLITEHEMIGFQAWLSAYHNTDSSDFIDQGSLHGRSGLIQAVINLEISHRHFSLLDVKIEGLNGQLPNLDLFNLAVELARREMITPTFHMREPISTSSPFEMWKHDVKTMLSMMSLQATGLPTGGHGLFHQYGIQAISIMSSTQNLRDVSKVTLIHVGRMLEGIFRSLNNLLEKFHQSFFFYLLPSTQRYISIGLYMPPFALIAAPILIHALHLYFKSKTPIQTKQDLHESHSLGLWLTMDIVIISYISGCLAYVMPDAASFAQTIYDWPLEDTFYYMLTVFLIIWLIFTSTYHRQRPSNQRVFSMKLCVCLLQLGAFLYTLSLTNISLATFLAVIYAPVTVFVKYRSRFTPISVFLVFLIHPYLLSYYVIMYQSCITDSGLAWSDHIWKAFGGHKKMLLYTVEDMYFYNNWNYKISTVLMLPLWHQLWMVVTAYREN